ncbi:hypothetical protein WSK_4139 [Novosphingobium sp. Rr 2-17]|uniref:hypothetical protein n=1 Tax=Novosphingobium sp. Rr 2-17 TaxID=555793 RepID=UPI000269A265|nr:hypothetical protein [Novosphingobium sp. Rr 2-17]EIZ77299.1 hypothetical protein WSK_4139 [Novosphingobium sp. Rr 2-17]
MDYRVKLVPQLVILDAEGQPVDNAHVIEIAFPGASIETLHGRVDTISGQGSAKIIVGDTTYRGVPLC